jgi:hypothetical protein
MELPLIRPKVGELVYRLYNRPLHPELFEVLSTRSITRDGYTLMVRLTCTGHVLSWTDGRIHLEEVTATEEMDLPEFGRKLGHNFQNDRNSQFDFPGEIRYRISSQLEVLPIEQFVHVHAELAADGARKGMVFHCRTGNRFGPSPLGVVIVQSVSRGLSTSAFHTFPDELTLIKTQSLIEW